MRALIFLLLLFFSCSKSSHWAFDQVHSGHAEFCSTKMTLHPADPVNGINVQLVKTQEHLKVYLNVHSTPISPHKGNPQKALLWMEIDGEKTNCEIIRLEGGQRFLLPNDIADTLIAALHEHHNVTLSLSGYRSQLISDGFSHQFKKLLNPFPFQNPFHMPI